METTKLNNFDILHCKGNHFLAKAIMFLTKGKFSHTALFFRVKGLPFVVDAQKDGFNLRSFDEWAAKFNYEFEVTRCPSLSVEEKRKMEKRLFEKIGMTGYDFESLIFRFPRKILFNKWKDKGQKEDDRFVCSEGVADIYGWPEPQKMSPQDVYNEALGKHFHVIVAKRNRGQEITFFG